MLYRNDKYGNKLSVLGFGCMRFPRGINGKISYEKTEKLILDAVEKGVNYFDTAYIYMGSEKILGEVISKNNLRKKIFIATKLPFAKVKNYDDFDRIFNKQLANLNTPYIDYYLIHNIASTELWKPLVALGIEKWIAEKKEHSKIRQIGFSFHGIQSDFQKLLDVYNWDFCQIQYNYMNENYQAGTVGLKSAAKKNIPVIIMEPLLGGKLADGVPKKGVEVLRKINPEFSPAQWSLRWIWNNPEVTVVLSGMNSPEQLSQNIFAANSSSDPFTNDEKLAIKEVKDIFKKAYRIPCTGCNYCLPCPKGVNIPGIFAAYNTSFANGFITGMMQYMTGTGANNPDKNYTAHRCIKCGKCEKQCPQNIKITSELRTATKKLEPFWFPILTKIINTVQK